MFNTFKKILSMQEIKKEDADKVSQFLLLRWLSGDPRLIPVAVALNQSKALPDNLIICQAIQTALQGKIKFIKYPSSKKSDKQSNQFIALISEYWDVGETEAREYYDWLLQRCPEELNELASMYKKDIRV